MAVHQTTTVSRRNLIRLAGSPVTSVSRPARDTERLDPLSRERSTQQEKNALIMLLRLAVLCKHTTDGLNMHRGECIVGARQTRPRRTITIGTEACSHVNMPSITCTFGFVRNISGHIDAHQIKGTLELDVPHILVFAHTHVP